jgi:hypothetical protein
VSAPSLARVRYDLAACKGHVESYFLKATDPSGTRAIWLKATVFASKHDPTRAIAEAWAVAFDRDRGHVAVKSAVPYETASFGAREMDIAFDGCTFTPDAWRGRIVTGAREVRWDLAIRDATRSLAHAPYRWMYDGPFPSFKLVSLAPDARVSGRVEIRDEADGRSESWTMDRWPGMIGHNWGTGHTPKYAWGHCNAWQGTDPGVVFEGASGQIAVGPVRAPMMTVLFLIHRGQRFAWNGLADLGRSRGDITLRRWGFAGKNRRGSIEGELWAKTDDFVGLFYANPDGKMTYCLNSKLADAELTFRPRGGAPLHLRSRAAALEIGTRDPGHGIRMYV